MSKYDNWKGSSCIGSRKWFVNMVRKYEKRTGTAPLTRKEIRGLSIEQLKALYRALYNEHHGFIR